jgi:hypothetical protein
MIFPLDPLDLKKPSGLNKGLGSFHRGLRSQRAVPSGDSRHRNHVFGRHWGAGKGLSGFVWFFRDSKDSLKNQKYNENAKPKPPRPHEKTKTH